MGGSPTRWRIWGGKASYNLGNGINRLLDSRMEVGACLSLRSGRGFGNALGRLGTFLLFLLLLLVFLLLAGLDSVATGLNPVHDPSNRHWVLARVISPGRNTLLDHGENILASSYVPGIVSAFRCLPRGPVEGGDAEGGGCGRQRRHARQPLKFGRMKEIPLKSLRRSFSAFAKFEVGSEFASVLRLRVESMLVVQVERTIGHVHRQFLVT